MSNNNAALGNAVTGAKLCALCQLPKILKKSHIVPEFMYQGMYDSKHRFLSISRDVSDRPRMHQKGFYEPLLCGDCEEKFSRYEGYAANVFYNNGAPSSTIEGSFITLRSVDYKKLKLFFLSLLWRFSVTTLNELKGASIGKHSEKLRMMLKSEDPGKELEYPFLLTAVMWQGNHIGDFIAPPMCAKLDAHHIWSFVVAGIVMSFYVSSHPQTHIPKEAFLDLAGTLRIDRKEITKIPYLHKFASEIQGANRARNLQLSASQAP
jgi:hypothetical protein